MQTSFFYSYGIHKNYIDEPTSIVAAVEKRFMCIFCEFEIFVSPYSELNTIMTNIINSQKNAYIFHDIDDIISRSMRSQIANVSAQLN